ncbi:hypothetical protein DCW30_31675 [Streptomyces alfalfae]|uniref:LXG domain-containing protein n=1 Tax=Streptomyces alfalfae TaxID=1642299 RepID=A0ABM6GWS5_9ACTN|nr:hypothetical protein [Streptomyces alfalfae]APY88584.1 hypothetical protein A7J05_25455 [Streptomyces alfalfae]AYA18996.1 hypothetical protein D3X13_24610 [Streptomyces fradiae]RXX36468.1 hypothetical protein DCW30_31675 [Streptomyces alfalfae]RZM90407.1 hypothetical protein D4104_24790 [Streptomyces alfalfae]
MTEKMVDPAGIPQFTGNLEQLAKDASGLRSAATGIRSGGADVHSRFQMLGAYYIAPEAEDLFSTTEPVMDKADTFAADLETVADALDTFASEVRPLAAKLVSLQEDARKFVASVEGDDDWTDDGDKTARNNELVADVTATRAAFEAAERRAASKISALVGGPRFIEDDGSHKATEQTVMYGYDADLLKQAEDLPWGSPVSQTRPDNLGGHLTSFFYDGFVMNGAVASVKGLGTLVGIGGSAKDAWKGLYDVSAGAGHYLMKPTDWVLDQTMFATEDTADMKRQKTAFREFGKAFVAWDQWEEHPVQAAGTVTFNALTLAAGPLGAVAKGGSAAGKVGLGAKAAGIGAKIGTYADPFSAGLTLGGKAVGKLPTVAEVTSRIRAGAGATANLERVHSTLEFEGTRVRVEDGEFILLDAESNPIRDAAPHEKSADERAVSEQAPPQREPALVSSESRTPGVVAHGSENLSLQASHDAQGRGGGTTDSVGKGQGGHSGAPNAGHAAGDSGTTQRPGTDHGSADVSHGSGSGNGNGTDAAPGSGGSAGADEGPARTPDETSPKGETQPIVRGGDTEQRVRDAVKGIPGKKRPKPDVLERVLARLASEPNGQRVADVIASGRFNQSDEFGQVVSSLGARKEAMYQPGADQILFADDLVRSGVPAEAIAFEHKVPVGADADIRIIGESGEVYSYQMKHLNDPVDPVSEISRGKYLLQLAKSEADHHIMLVDGGRGARAEWISNGSYDELMDIHRGGRGPKGEGITFVVRLEDGTLVIPPGSKTDPKDML